MKRVTHSYLVIILHLLLLIILRSRHFQSAHETVHNTSYRLHCMPSHLTASSPADAEYRDPREILTASDDAETTDDGNSFHTRAPATPKARSPTVHNRVRGTISWCVVADRRRRRELS